MVFEWTTECFLITLDFMDYEQKKNSPIIWEEKTELIHLAYQHNYIIPKRHLSKWKCAQTEFDRFFSNSTYQYTHVTVLQSVQTWNNSAEPNARNQLEEKNRIHRWIEWVKPHKYIKSHHHTNKSYRREYFWILFIVLIHEREKNWGKVSNWSYFFYFERIRICKGFYILASYHSFNRNFKYHIFIKIKLLLFKIPVTE